MHRQITPEEIERLAEYNKTHKYVSIEAYQDMLNWTPDELKSSKDILEIFRSTPEEHKDEFFDMLEKEITAEIDQEILDLKKFRDNYEQEKTKVQ